MFKILDKYNNSYPSVFHCPNAKSEIWYKLSPLAIKYNKINNCKLLSLITWNSKTSVGFLEKFCQLHNLNLTVLGKNTIWNNLNKFHLNIEFLEKTSCEYVIGLDCYDTFLIDGLDIILDKFIKLNCKMLFNSEIKFYPGFIKNDYFDECFNFQNKISNNKFKFLNSGAWIGERKFCLNFFKDCSKIQLPNLFDCSKYPKLYNSDQSVVHTVFKKYYPDVRLDYNCNIFKNTSYLTLNDIQVKLITM